MDFKISEKRKSTVKFKEIIDEEIIITQNEIDNLITKLELDDNQTISIQKKIEEHFNKNNEIKEIISNKFIDFIENYLREINKKLIPKINENELEKKNEQIINNKNKLKLNLDIIKTLNIEKDKYLGFSVDYLNDNDPFSSKSSLILERLKKIKEKAQKNYDKEILEDINWIIQTFSENNIHEPQINLNNKIKDNPDSVEAMGLLSKYSKNGHLNRRESDYRIVKSRNELNGLLSQTSSILNQTEKSGFFRRKSSSNKGSLMNYFISPSLFAKVANNLSMIETYQFNIFELDQLLEKKTLISMATEIFTRKNFFEILIPEDKFENFIKEVSDGYSRDVQYHNDLHAGDVFQTLNLILKEGEAQKKLELTDLDMMAILLAAICHDFKHNGFTNTYHINSKSDIALTYNEPEEYRIARRRMIDGILHTDMESHSKNLLHLKTKMESLDIKKGVNLNKLTNTGDINKTFENQQDILGYCLHACDISAAAKDTKICHKWRDLVFLEFFNQGDLEKKNGLNTSILCDRNTTKINTSQIGFINFIAKPTFDLLFNIFPEIYPYLNNINLNLRIFQKLSKEDEEKK